MTNDRKQTAAELFKAAIALDPAERSQFIERTCAGDTALADGVRELLRADAMADGFLETPIRPALDCAACETDDPLIGQRVGKYEIRGLIASGGMGIVYEAWQDHPTRCVALKVLRSGLASQDALRRFSHEAEFLARLRHPGIAQVFEAGWHGGNTGFPFFAMECIDVAKTITRYAGDEQLSTRRRLEIFADVCDAVHHGHQRGVIHRDLKPGNILVNESGQPKVIDFGVARATDADMTVATLRTDVGQLLGTLHYMSPEQCEGDAGSLDTRCDVYALGVVLFELLTDELPYDFTTRSPFEIPRLIREQPPRRLSAFNRSLRGDMETIVLKALEKEPQRRYQSASDLAGDIRRFLDNKPIEAKRDRSWYVFRKFLSRHKLPVAAAALFVLLIISSAVGLRIMYTKADRQRIEAQEARDTAERRTEALRRTSYFNLIALAQNACENGDAIQLRELLGRCPVDLRHWEWGYLHHQSDDSLWTIHCEQGTGVRAALSPDADKIATGGSDGSLRLWTMNGQLVAKSPVGHLSRITQIVWSPDGACLASASDDGTVRVWNGDTGKTLLKIAESSGAIRVVAFHRAGQEILTVTGSGSISLWNTATGGMIRQYASELGSGVCCGGVSPDGDNLALGTADGRIILWGIEKGAVTHALSAHQDKIGAIVFSPDGQRLYSGSWTKETKVWNVKTGKLLATLPRCNDNIYGLSLSPRGDRLAIAQGAAIDVLDTKSGTRVRRYLGHHHTVTSVEYSPDGAHLVSGSHDKAVKLWDARQGQAGEVLLSHDGVVESVAYSPDGRWIASAGRDNLVRLWDAHRHSDHAMLTGHESWVFSLAFSPDGRRIVSGSGDHSARVWNVETGEPILKLEQHDNRVHAVAWSSNAEGPELIATGSWDGTIGVWSSDSGALQVLMTEDVGEVFSLCFLPGGDKLASGSRDGLIRLWDVRDGRLIATLSGHTQPVQCLAGFRAATMSAILVSGSEDGTLRIWDASTGRTLHVLTGHLNMAMDAAFSPDGRRIVSASYDDTLKIWDVETGQVILTLRGHEHPVYCVAFSPDGRRIVSGSAVNNVRVWAVDDAK